MKALMAWLDAVIKAIMGKLYPEPTNPSVPQKSGVEGVPTPQPSDWVRGQETGIRDSVRNVSGDWRPYLSPGKWQRDIPGGTLFETEACMSFTPIDSLEAQFNFMLAFDLISDNNAAWLISKGYLDTDGKMNISPRFTAKMSGTSMNGNNYQAVWGSVRNDGVVPESVWPAHFELLKAAPSVSGQTQENWDTYYAQVWDTAVALGKEFKSRFTVQYEWVNQTGHVVSETLFKDALKLAPLHITSAVCMPWNTTSVIQGCGIGTAHATLMTFIDGNGVRHIRDHYQPFDKLFAPNYAIPFATRGVVFEVITPNVPDHFTHVFTTPYRLGDTAVEIELIQNLLKIKGCFPLTVASSGYYGSITATAVEKFQKQSGISPTAPNNIGLRTLAAINTAVAALGPT